MNLRESTPLDEPSSPPPDRRDCDGDAGMHDMLGGLSTGAGGTMGVDPPDSEAFVPGPISEYQHRFDDLDPATDSATTVHSVADLPTEGA